MQILALVMSLPFKRRPQESFTCNVVLFKCDLWYFTWWSETHRSWRFLPQKQVWAAAEARIEPATSWERHTFLPSMCSVNRPAQKTSPCITIDVPRIMTTKVANPLNCHSLRASASLLLWSVQHWSAHFQWAIHVVLYLIFLLPSWPLDASTKEQTIRILSVPNIEERWRSCLLLL